MAIKDYLLSFNRGIISPLARARADVDRVGMSAEEQMNWIPRSLGSMMLRPGFEFIADAGNPYGAVRVIPFIYATADTAIIGITHEKLRIVVDDVPVGRAAVSTTVTNGGFDTDLANWTDADQGSAASTWVTGGFMSLVGTGNQGAIRYQELTISGADDETEHALRINVESGIVGLRIGTTTSLDDIVSETYLRTGTHSIAFTPGDGVTSVFVLFFNREKVEGLIDSVEIEAEGVLSFDTNLLPGETLDELRYVQSGDIVFMARGRDYFPVQVERRSTTSWSIVRYLPDDGPYLADNLTPITLNPSAITGNITIAASQDIFQAGNVGSLFRLTSNGQTRNATLGADDDATEALEVTGITDNRIFGLEITGTWSGDILLQQSVGQVGDWFTIETYTTNQNTTYDDGLDNQIVYYRLIMDNYVSGSASVSIRIPTGSITGVVRITAFTDTANVNAVVLKDLGNADPTRIWAEGAWSTRRGFPSAVMLHQGRLCWAGKAKFWGSVVDDFYNFDPDYPGDAGPINRSIGQGPVDKVHWLESARRLIMGTEGAEVLIRSTEFEEPLTPTNVNMRIESTHGSSAVSPVKMDASIMHMDRTKARLMAIEDDLQGVSTYDMSLLTPEVLLPNVVRSGIQRRPDTRIHLIRCDGTAVVVIYDKLEEVKAFVTVETRGLIEDVVVLPGTPEDDVYYIVIRMVGGIPVRYLEKWAHEDKAVGGVQNHMLDSFKVYNDTSTSTITGLDHLNGRVVSAWGNSKPLGSYTVTGGQITLSEAVTYAVVGLTYHSSYISGKLGFLTQGVKALSNKRRVLSGKILLKDTHEDGLEFGTDASYLDSLPPIENGAAVTADTLWDYYEEDEITFNSNYDHDERLHLKATAPKPCTVLAAVLTLEEE